MSMLARYSLFFTTCGRHLNSSHVYSGSPRYHFDGMSLWFRQIQISIPGGAQYHLDGVRLWYKQVYMFIPGGTRYHCDCLWLRDYQRMV